LHSPAEPARRAVADIHELLSLVDLADMIVFEERGRRIEWTDEEVAKHDFPMTSNSLGISSAGSAHYFRFRIVFTDRGAEYVADFCAQYDVSEDVSVSDEIATDFAERVAFMATYPFLRASIYGSASRLNQPVPILGLVKLGDFRVGETMPDSDVNEAFGDNVSELL
jgi:hypothetical protein